MEANVTSSMSKTVLDLVRMTETGKLMVDYVADLVIATDSTYLALVAVLVIASFLAMIRKCLKRGAGKLEKSSIGSGIAGVSAAAATGIAGIAGGRFRKRDKIAFMGRRVFRNAKAVGSLIRGGQGKKRKAVAKLVKKVFHRSSPSGQGSDAGGSKRPPDLPDAYFEEEEDILPPALLLVLNNLRVFGHFDNKIFVELMKSIEYVTLRPNSYLFRVGDPDAYMYIVESGRLKLYSSTGVEGDSPNSYQTLKSVGPGEPILSLLSFMRHLGGVEENLRTVSAKTTEETKIIKFAFESFKLALQKHPDQLAKVVQVVMIRLQRVTLLALHQYLGLGAELFTRGSRRPSFSATDKTFEEMARKHKNLTKSFSDCKDVNDLDYHQLQDLATDMFLEILSLEEENVHELEEMVGLRIKDYVSISSWEPGDVLIEEEMAGEAQLMIVLRGVVRINQTQIDEDVQVEIKRTYPGGFLGQLQTLTDEPSFYTAKAMRNDVESSSDDGDVTVATLDARFVRRCIDQYPKVAVVLAGSVIDELSPYVRSIDFALEWLQLQSGKALYKQGQPADSTYVVLSGRLRSVISKKDSKREVVGEYTRGDLTGIVETLMKTPRSTTVMAVRDTEVAKIPAGLLDAIKVRYPVVLHRLIKMLGQKVQQSWERGSPGASHAHFDPGQTTGVQGNFSTVAIISASPNIPVNAFTFELLHALIQIDPCLRLTKEYIIEEMGEDIFHKSNDFKLSDWLGHQEDKHRIVLYQCDSAITDWTRLCIRHADVIFILTDPKGDSKVTSLERNLESLSKRTRKELIFLHNEDTVRPDKVDHWFKDRGFINFHYHIKCSRRMYSRKTKYSKIIDGPGPSIHSDFSRLARAIAGQTVGLVLGGGGARGCAHIGMIKAILEAGIPIDYVSGVSIGSFIGGLYALERDLTQVTIKAREFSSKTSQIWRWIMDFTNPHTSYFNGYNFNKILESLFGSETDIRQTWLPYFTVTTDISNSSCRVHDYGSLWRYVRASMSLAGWLPPMCDPIDGHLLLDGGYSNNLPADVMRTRGAKHIMAIDVGAEDNSSFTNYGDTLSGFQIFFSKWNPFGKPIYVPNQTEVQLRLAYVSCVDKLESVKNSGYCEYIRPPIEKYGTLQFNNFEEIKEVGYRHGETYFKGFKKAGLMRQFYWSNPSSANRRQSIFSMSSAIRRRSIDNISTLASSVESGGSISPSGVGDIAKLMESFKGSSPSRDRSRGEAFGSVCEARVTSSTSSDSEAERVEDPVAKLIGHPGSRSPSDDYEDIDSENLISDEEDDNESGFLSQM